MVSRDDVWCQGGISLSGETRKEMETRNQRLLRVQEIVGIQDLSLEEPHTLHRRERAGERVSGEEISGKERENGYSCIAFQISLGRKTSSLRLKESFPNLSILFQQFWSHQEKRNKEMEAEFGKLPSLFKEMK